MGRAKFGMHKFRFERPFKVYIKWLNVYNWKSEQLRESSATGKNRPKTSQIDRFADEQLGVDRHGIMQSSNLIKAELILFLGKDRCNS
jgi:hypothetical protein